MGRPYSDAAEAANTAAVVTVKRNTGLRTVIESATVSYSAAPAGGRVTIVGTSSSWAYDFDVTAAGATTFHFGSNGLEFEADDDVVATLFPGGAAVVGKLNLNVKRIPLAS